MKINKNTSIICIIFTIIFGGITIWSYPYYQLISSIVSSIFTGFIVSSVVALIGYFYEKGKIINNISDNMDSLYINLVAIKDITGIIVPKVATTEDLTKLNYDIIEALAYHNVEFIKKMKLEFYDGFFSNSKLSKITNEFINYNKEMYKLKQVVFELYCSTLEYELQVKNIKLLGIETSIDNIKVLDEYKNSINIKTAKLHEYEASLILKLDTLAEGFCKYHKQRLNWDKSKGDLQQEADVLIKRCSR